jgi:hypothetical protein
VSRVKDEDGELYFATSNTVLRRLGATAVAAAWVAGHDGDLAVGP